MMQYGVQECSAPASPDAPPGASGFWGDMEEWGKGMAKGNGMSHLTEASPFLHVHEFNSAICLVLYPFESRKRFASFN